ncbi:MAG: hypothetical protein LBB38_01540 [Puniceicoccales bacterium]|jgi:hypothetical protein|nr:hypothetical protein [Puniceicoccales bacterium]
MSMSPTDAYRRSLNDLLFSVGDKTLKGTLALVDGRFILHQNGEGGNFISRLYDKRAKLAFAQELEAAAAVRGVMGIPAPFIVRPHRATITFGLAEFPSLLPLDEAKPYVARDARRVVARAACSIASEFANSESEPTAIEVLNLTQTITPEVLSDRGAAERWVRQNEALAATLSRCLNPRSPSVSDTFAALSAIVLYARAMRDGIDLGHQKATLAGRGAYNTVFLVDAEPDKKIAFKPLSCSIDKKRAASEIEVRGQMSVAAFATASVGRMLHENGMGLTAVAAQPAMLGDSPGIAMEALKCRRLSHIPLRDKLWRSAEYRRDETAAQILDFICGDMDPHLGNVYENGRRIDSDRNFSPMVAGMFPRTIIGNEPSMASTYAPFGFCMPRVIDTDQARAIMSIDEGVFADTLRADGLRDDQIEAALARLRFMRARIIDETIIVINPNQWRDEELLMQLGCNANNSYFQFHLALKIAIKESPRARWHGWSRMVDQTKWYRPDGTKSPIPQSPTAQLAASPRKMGTRSGARAALLHAAQAIKKEREALSQLDPTVVPPPNMDGGKLIALLDDIWPGDVPIATPDIDPSHEGSICAAVANRRDELFELLSGITSHAAELKLTGRVSETRAALQDLIAFADAHDEGNAFHPWDSRVEDETTIDENGNRTFIVHGPHGKEFTFTTTAEAVNFRTFRDKFHPEKAIASSVLSGLFARHGLTLTATPTSLATLDGRHGLRADLPIGKRLSEVEDLGVTAQSADFRRRFTSLQIVDFIRGNSDQRSESVSSAGELLSYGECFPEFDSGATDEDRFPTQAIYQAEGGGFCTSFCMPKVIDDEQRNAILETTGDELRLELLEVGGMTEAQINDSVARLQCLKDKVANGTVRVIQREAWADARRLQELGCTPTNSYFLFYPKLEETKRTHSDKLTGGDVMSQVLSVVHSSGD